MIVFIGLIVTFLAAFRISDSECSKKEGNIMKKAIGFVGILIAFTFLFPQEKDTEFKMKESNFQQVSSFSEGMAELEVRLEGIKNIQDTFNSPRVIVLPEMVIMGERQEEEAFSYTK